MPTLTKEQLIEQWYGMDRDNQIENIVHIIRKLMYQDQYKHLIDLLYTTLQLNPKESQLVEDVEIYTKLKLLLG